jgi:hypothetical protein
VKIVECSGSPKEIGHAVGEELRDEIREHIALVARPRQEDWWERFLRRLPVINRTLDRYLPEERAEMEAMARAARLPVEEIYLANHLHLWGNGLDPADEDEACSNIVFAGGPDGPLLGKNNDGYYRTRTNPRKPTFVKRVRRENGIPAIVVTTAGSLCTGDGMNGEGVAIGSSSVGSVFEQSDRFPAIRLWNYRCLLRARSATEFAEASARTQQRGKGFSMVCVDPSGTAISIEAPCPVTQIRRPDYPTGISCTNYYQLPQLAHADRRSAECRKNAVRRKEFFDSVLAGDGPFDLNHIKSVMRHKGEVSICCTEERDLLHTHHSVIAAPATGALYVCDGPPCHGEYLRLAV